VADNFPIARQPTATGNLESFTRLNECLGDLPLIDYTVRNRFREAPLLAYFGFATTASELKS
jgi:hypothetical protein